MRHKLQGGAEGKNGEKRKTKASRAFLKTNDDLSNPVTKTKRNISCQTEWTRDAWFIHQISHHVSFPYRLLSVRWMDTWWCLAITVSMHNRKKWWAASTSSHWLCRRSIVTTLIQVVQGPKAQSNFILPIIGSRVRQAVNKIPGAAFA